MASYLTEDEAKKLWCPFSASSSDSQKCLASECMAWRKGTYKETTELGVCGLVRFAPDR